jgi:MFS family permease
MSAPLRQREFRLLFSGQVVSNLGDWLDYLALAVLIAYVWDKGPEALAALAIVIALPWIFVAPFAGVLVDRWPKRSVLIGADLARAAVVVGLVFAPNLYVLLVLVAFKTTFSTFFNPAEQATIRIIVPESQLHAANALSQFVVQSTKVIGPALGGVLVALFSPRVAFGVDAFTFLVSAAILTRLPAIVVPRDASEDGAEEDDEDEGGYWAELRAGFAYIASRRALMIGIASFAGTIFILFAFDALSPLAFRELGVSRALFGLAVAGIGAGGVLGAVLVGRRGGDVNPFVLMGGAEVIIGGMVALIGVGLLTELDAPPLVWTPVLLVVGIASAGVLVGGPTIIQRETPPELMGRVSTTATSIPTAFQMFAPLIGAALAKWQSVGFVFTLAGGALALLGAIVLTVRPPVGIGVGAPEEPLTDVHGQAQGPAELNAVRRYAMADVDVLKAAGFDLDSLSSDEQAAVGRLSQDELDSLASIRAKLNAEPEVSGHMKPVAGDGNFVW